MPLTTKIMLIRHGEKPGAPDAGPGLDPNGNDDPQSLTARGWQRAKALADLFNPASPKTLRAGLAVPKYLFASEISDPESSKRPLETLTPLSESFTPPRSIDASIKSSHIDKICLAAINAGDTVLIAWKHEIIPAIAQGLTSDSVPGEWPGSRFDVIWIFDLGADGKYRFSQMPQLVLPGDLDQVIAL